MSNDKEVEKTKPEAPTTPEGCYRALLRERIIINAHNQKLEQDRKTLHERNLVIEGGMQSLENEHKFDRKVLGDEVLKSIQAEQEAKKAGK